MEKHFLILDYLMKTEHQGSRAEGVLPAAQQKSAEAGLVCKHWTPTAQLGCCLLWEVLFPSCSTVWGIVKYLQAKKLYSVSSEISAWFCWILQKVQNSLMYNLYIFSYYFMQKQPVCYIICCWRFLPKCDKDSAKLLASYQDQNSWTYSKAQISVK